MRLLKLSLDNWRGVAALAVEFSEGVTLIEGPNEIGKSSIVEAVRMLFNELDSSKKYSVKAIKPVDQDIGSHVEVEVKSGKYHFIYSKTFNKTTQTSLNVLAPSKKQLTGREAHETVEKMLDETVDMALWEALLVDQGEKVALANIQDSAGLAKALDKAASSTATGSDETGLYEAVKNEYERYFTLKTGKSRFSAEETAYDKAGVALEAAQKAVAEVETTAEAHHRSAAEVLRIKAELPELKDKVTDYEKVWQAVKSLKDIVEAKNKECVATQSIQQVALDAQSTRQSLIDDIMTGQDKVDEARKKQEPLQEKTDKLKGQSGNAQLVIADWRTKVKAARINFDLAQEDQRHVHNLEALDKEKNRLKQLGDISEKKKSSVQVLGSIKINDAAMERLREAESRLAIARGTRNTAAFNISVTAETKFVMELDGEEVSLRESEVVTRTVASQLRMRLPGIATIEITPSQSVAELQEEVEDAEEALGHLMSPLGVNNLKEAVIANEQRADAQRDVDRLKAREEEILQGDSVEEIEQAVSSYQAECDRYVNQRQSQQGLPESAADASKRVSNAKSDLSSPESALEAAQERADTLRENYGKQDSQLRIMQQTLAGLAAALTDKKGRLDKARSNDSDGKLDERAAKANAGVMKLEREAASLEEKLSESSPDSTEALLKNSGDVYERATSDLISEEQNLAVLADRLQQAQADGRFEEMETAERNLEESQRTFELIQRRAEAIELLWKTLNEHRDTIREAYVKPLKEAIERLGKIVFGSEFEVEIGDDWTILTRTLHGKTLPFDYLSIGAKEQLGILARLAAAQIVAKHGGAPLIIDDALGFSDPSRLEKIGAAIAAAGEHCQIIILTCTPGRFTHVGKAEVVRL
ncbi:MAG: AAA family ATPase [Proteobacteria bacterium]|nr:AAA family ATPase [Pseudomonadota bacterium]